MSQISAPAIPDSQSKVSDEDQTAEKFLPSCSEASGNSNSLQCDGWFSV